MIARFVVALILTLACVITIACGSSGAPGPAAPSATFSDRAGSGVDASRQEWAQNASWAPGQLQEHFAKHGREGPYSSITEYDWAARDTVVTGTRFTYVDRESRAQRVGFYHGPTNRFTSLTADGQRITTFFHPDRRDSYVRGLDRSTFK
jgi:hypothetical protein